MTTSEDEAQEPQVKPQIWLLRHGETEWSRSGQYTGLTNIPLTSEGERQAAAAQSKVSGVRFDRVVVSPLQRAVRTAELAGFSDFEVDPSAHEWDYGEYEGISSAAVAAARPGYVLWCDGVPGGETLTEVAQRADKVLQNILDQTSSDATATHNVLLVSHGHFLRIFTARWLGLKPEEGRHFVLATAAVCTLGWDKNSRAIVRWGL